MLKKIKENPYYVKFKEMRADPKLRPITSLIFWLIFFVILIVFVRSLPDNSNYNASSNVNEIVSNYKFTYTNNNLTVFGESYDDKLDFVIGNSHYYYNGESVYFVKNQSMTLIPNFNLSVLKINPSMINNLIGNLTYSMSGDAKEYAVPLSRFLNLYEVDVEADLSLANQYNIIVKVYEKNSEVYMYQLDLINYYNFRGLNNDGILTIDIYGEVEDFTKYYDKLIGGVL